jgi:hypothetical protein
MCIRFINLQAELGVARGRKDVLNTVLNGEQIFVRHPLLTVASKLFESVMEAAARNRPTVNRTSTHPTTASKMCKSIMKPAATNQPTVHRSSTHQDHSTHLTTLKVIKPGLTLNEIIA